MWTSEIAEYAQITMPNKRSYCRLFGYNLVEQTEKLDSRPAPWTKLAILQRILASYDWAFWTDADSLFMRDDVALAEMIDDDADLIWSEDDNGPNTGQFFLRSCPAVLEMLRVADGRHDLTWHRWWEQEAIRQTVKSGLADLRIKVVPARQFNSPEAHYADGDFVVHVPGTVDKLAALRRHAQRTAFRV